MSAEPTPQNLALESITYRGRSIVVQSAEDVSLPADHSDGMDFIIHGMQVRQDGHAVTPLIDGFFSGRAYDGGYDDYYGGYALIGDFILVIYQNRRRARFIKEEVCSICLLVEESQGEVTIKELVERNPLLTTQYGFSDALGGLHGCVRAFDTTLPEEGGKEWPVTFVRAGCYTWCHAIDLDACGGAARIFTDSHGWRWLFPHEGGPQASLEQLKATSDYDDWRRIQPFVREASDKERALVRAHFLAIGYDGPHRDATSANNEDYRGTISRGRLESLKEDAVPAEVPVFNPDFVKEVLTVLPHPLRRT